MHTNKLEECQMQKFIIGLIFLAMVSCGQPQQSSSLKQELENNYLDVITMEGSSNTSGQGADFTLEQLVEHHFFTKYRKTLYAIKSKKIFASIDYLFPTNFPQYYEKDLSPEEIEVLAFEKLEALVARKFDHYVLVNFLNLDTLSAELKNKANEARFAPFVAIDNALSANPTQAKNQLAVNRAYAKIAAKYDHVIVVDLNETFVKPILVSETFSVDDAAWNQWTKQNLTSAFVADNVHLNTTGQALIFNLSILPGLRQLPSLEKTPRMSVNLNITDKWKKSVNELFFDNSDASFINFANGTFQVQPTDKSQLASSNATLKNMAEATSISDKKAAQSVATVTYVIEKVMAANDPAPFSIKLSNGENGRRVIGLDLDKLFKYTWTDLVETEKGSGEFVAYGSDYFTSTNKTSFITQNFLSLNGIKLTPNKLLDYNAHYWYYFKASADANNPKIMNVDWYLIPPFDYQGKDITPPQDKRELGVKSSERTLIDQILEGSITTPYVKYTISLELK